MCGVIQQGWPPREQQNIVPRGPCWTWIWLSLLHQPPPFPGVACLAPTSLPREVRAQHFPARIRDQFSFSGMFSSTASLFEAPPGLHSPQLFEPFQFGMLPFAHVHLVPYPGAGLVIMAQTLSLLTVELLVCLDSRLPQVPD